MKILNNQLDYAHRNPAMTGVATVLAVVLIGVGIGFGAGFANPSGASADEFGGFEVSGITVTAPVAPPIVAPIVTPVVTPVVAPVIASPVANPISSPVANPVSNPASSNNSSDNTNTVAEVTVIAEAPAPVAAAPVVTIPVNLQPCCTDTTVPVSTPVTIQPTTPVNLQPCCTDTTVPVVAPMVVPTTPVNLKPCCTDTSVPTTPVTIPATTGPTTPVNLKPCCTDTTVPVTTPVVPVTTTPTTPVDLKPCCTDVPPPTLPPTVPPVTPPVVPPVTPPVTPPTLAQCLFLSADKSVISVGEAVTLSWGTANATSISITNTGDAYETSVDSGTKVVYPQGDTTYVATVTGTNGQSVHCQAQVKIKTIVIHNQPACIALTADKSLINPGEAVTLSWQTQNASAISIDNGIGNVTPVQGGLIVVHPTGATTYTATVPGAPATNNCQVTVSVRTPSCSDTNSCGTGGGGGGGGGTSGSGGGGSGVHGSGGSGQLAQYVYLSQIPYTGLDLGPVGTAIYWIILVLWCLAATYLALFVIIPFLFRRMTSFGQNVQTVLNNQTAMVPAGAPAVPAQAAPAPLSYASYAPAAPTAVAKSYSPDQGFSSFAPAGAALTIDDIVKGLSREQGGSQAPSAAPASEAPTELVPVSEVRVNPQPEVAPAAQPAPAQAAQAPKPAAAAVAPDVRDFVAALLQGNRDAVFGAIRQTVREGGSAEDFLTQVVVALDDAYRAPLEGTPVNPEIANLTKGCAPAFLERLVSALTSAVDSSYSAGITGAKLAVTRALAVVEG